jgi:hypothetical protein
MISSSIPQQIVINTGNGQNYLSWAQVAGATNYVVQRSPSGLLGTFVTIASPVVNNYLDNTVTIGVQYWYQIASQSGLVISGFNATGTNSLPLIAVPCLPGQINLGYLRYQSKLRADKLNSNFLTDDEWNFNINQSANRLYDVLVTKFGDKYFLAPPVQFNSGLFQNPQNSGLNVFPLPDGQLFNGAPALYKLAGVDVSTNQNNNQWFTMPKFNWIDRNKYSTLQLAGTTNSVFGLQYCENGRNMFVIPIAAIVAFQYWYVPVLKQLLQDTDMMDFSISGWSELVIVDAGIKALIKEESFDQAQILINERSGILERIETTAANRDVGTPNTVSNTRNAAGDPNFPNWGNGGNGWGGGGGWGS